VGREIAASIVAVGGQQGVLYEQTFAGVTSAQVPTDTSAAAAQIGRSGRVRPYSPAR